MNEQEVKTAKTLGIVALALAIFIPLAAIICGHISLSKYKKLGATEGKGLAVGGLILGYVVFVGYFIIGILGAIGGAVAAVGG